MRYKKEDGTTDYDKIVRELESFYKSSEMTKKKEYEEESYKGCTLWLSLITAMIGFLTLLWAILTHYGVI